MKREKSKTDGGKPLTVVALLSSLLKSINEEEEMLTLTKKELAVLDEAQPDYAVYLIETEHEKNRWWHMRVKLPAQEKVYEVVTALGRQKLWKRLDIAIDFIKDTCPRTTVVIIALENPT